MGEVQIQGHGARVQLLAPEELILAAARAFAPTVAVGTPTAAADATVQVDGARRRIHSTSLGVSTAGDHDDLARLVASVVQLELAAHAAPQVFVHAGVVAHRGGGLVLPGRSGVGKTTLVAALVAAGATYYSDEYAVLDQHGDVAPFAKPLSVRSSDGRSRLVDPGSLGPVGGEPVPVVLVAALEHRSGAEWDPTLVHGAEVALPIVEHAVPARRRVDDTLDAAAAVARSAALVRGPRGEADATAVALLALLDRAATSHRNR